jgi:adenylosuccinate lyase
MTLNPLEAVSPIDGRYRRTTEMLAGYFSEGALIRYRVRIEIEYFIALCNIPLPQLRGFNGQHFEALRDVYRHFSIADAQKVKDIEKMTNHDVKAVEYFIKARFDKLDIGAFKEFIHFASPRRISTTRPCPWRSKRPGRRWSGLHSKGGKGIGRPGPPMESHSHAGPHPWPAGIANTHG